MFVSRVKGNLMSKIVIFERIVKKNGSNGLASIKISKEES